MLGIFPEGTRSKDGGILPFQQGAALLSMRAGVPVIPVYIKGGYKLFHQVRVYVEPPILLKDIAGEKTSGEAIKKATVYLHDKMVEMSKRDD
jgi:1-acyl-sn-glycerol-3-phosphate acyltransferase